MASAALLAEPVPRLQEAIDGLAQEDLELVPAASLGDDLRGLRSAIDRLEAEFSRRLEHFDRNQGYVPSGYCSAAGWLNDECRMTRSTAWERVRQARRLAELPATSEAFAAGEVNLATWVSSPARPSRLAARLYGTRSRSSWRRPEARCPAAALRDRPAPALSGPQRQPQRRQSRLRAPPPPPPGGAA